MSQLLENSQAIILAGGYSSRIGKDKGQLRLKGKQVSQIVVDLVKSIFPKLIYVTNTPELAPNNKGLLIIRDEIPHQGPLGGVLTGLKASNSKYNFVVGYDMPFLNKSLITYMLRKRKQAEAIIPKTKRGLEPLHAIYQRSCIKPMEQEMRIGNFRVVSFLPYIKKLYIEEEEIRQFDPEMRSFFSINTWDDYEKAKEIFNT